MKNSTPPTRRESFGLLAKLVSAAVIVPSMTLEALAGDFADVVSAHEGSKRDSETVPLQGNFVKQQFQGHNGEYFVLEDGYKDGILISGTSNSCPESDGNCRVQYFVSRATGKGPINRLELMFTVTREVESGISPNIHFLFQSRDYKFKGTFEDGRFGLYGMPSAVVKVGHEEGTDDMTKMGKEFAMKSWFEKVSGHSEIIVENLPIFLERLNLMTTQGRPAMPEGYNPLQPKYEVRELK